jgi:hypothetical protein
MSDFLTRLAQRQLGPISSVEPRVADWYAPAKPTIPAELSLSRTMTETPSALAKPNSGQSVILAVPNIEEPARVANPAQRWAAKTGEEPDSSSSIENVSAEVAPLVEPSLAAAKTDKSLPRQFNPEQSDSLPARSQAPASHGLLAPNTQPGLLIAERVTAMAAPPRLEFNGPSRNEISELLREPADSESPVHVTIGRIEVTAVSAAPVPRRAAMARKPSMSLDDYLTRRQRGER